MSILEGRSSLLGQGPTDYTTQKYLNEYTELEDKVAKKKAALSSKYTTLNEPSSATTPEYDAWLNDTLGQQVTDTKKAREDVLTAQSPLQNLTSVYGADTKAIADAATQQAIEQYGLTNRREIPGKGILYNLPDGKEYSGDITNIITKDDKGNTQESLLPLQVGSTVKSINQPVYDKYNPNNTPSTKPTNEVANYLGRELLNVGLQNSDYINPEDNNYRVPRKVLKDTDRSFGTIAKDVGLGVAQAMVNSNEALIGMAQELPILGDKISEWQGGNIGAKKLRDRTNAAIQSTYSPELQQEMLTYEEDKRDNAKSLESQGVNSTLSEFMGALGAMSTNPAMAAHIIAQGVGSLPHSALLTGTASTLAGPIAGPIIASGLLLGSTTAQQAVDMVLENPLKTVELSKEFAEEMVRNGGDTDKALEYVASQAKIPAFAAGAAIGAITTGLLHSGSLDKALAEGKLTPDGLFKTMFKEGGQELVESPGEQAAADLAYKLNVDPDHEFGKDYGYLAAEGMVGGMGAGALGASPQLISPAISGVVSGVNALADKGRSALSTAIEYGQQVADAVNSSIASDDKTEMADTTIQNDQKVKELSDEEADKFATDLLNSAFSSSLTAEQLTDLSVLSGNTTARRLNMPASGMLKIINDTSHPRNKEVVEAFDEDYNGIANTASGVAGALVISELSKIAKGQNGTIDASQLTMLIKGLNRVAGFPEDVKNEIRDRTLAEIQGDNLRNDVKLAFGSDEDFMNLVHSIGVADKNATVETINRIKANATEESKAIYSKITDADIDAMLAAGKLESAYTRAYANQENDNRQVTQEVYSGPRGMLTQVQQALLLRHKDPEKAEAYIKNVESMRGKQENKLKIVNQAIEEARVKAGLVLNEYVTDVKKQNPGISEEEANKQALEKLLIDKPFNKGGKGGVGSVLQKPYGRYKDKNTGEMRTAVLDISYDNILNPVWANKGVFEIQAKIKDEIEVINDLLNVYNGSVKPEKIISKLEGKVAGGAAPTPKATQAPTVAPTPQPTQAPTSAPTEAITEAPTSQPALTENQIPEEYKPFIDAVYESYGEGLFSYGSNLTANLTEAEVVAALNDIAGLVEHAKDKLKLSATEARDNITVGSKSYVTLYSESKHSNAALNALEEVISGIINKVYSEEFTVPEKYRPFIDSLITELTPEALVDLLDVLEERVKDAVEADIQSDSIKSEVMETSAYKRLDDETTGNLSASTELNKLLDSFILPFMYEPKLITNESDPSSATTQETRGPVILPTSKPEFGEDIPPWEQPPLNSYGDIEGYDNVDDIIEQGGFTSLEEAESAAANNNQAAVNILDKVNKVIAFNEQKKVVMEKRREVFKALKEKQKTIDNLVNKVIEDSGYNLDAAPEDIKEYIMTGNFRGIIGALKEDLLLLTEVKSTKELAEDMLKSIEQYETELKGCM